MDTMTREQRSRLMAKIRGDNLKPERRLADALIARGICFDRNRADLPGKPDFVMADGLSGIAVFVHGCFWHCCPRHFRPVDKGRNAAWLEKFKKNMARDRRVRRQILRKHWLRTMVVWEHDLKTQEQAARVAERIDKRLGI